MAMRRRVLSSMAAASEYPHLCHITTRWHDNDAFGHVNNVVYYSFMDTAVNTHLLQRKINERRFVASSSCRYLQPLAYPQSVLIGLGVSKLGRSSVQYQIGIFSLPFSSPEPSTEQSTLCAEGSFTHVYVDAFGRPSPIATHARAVLSELLLIAE